MEKEEAFAYCRIMKSAGCVSFRDAPGQKRREMNMGNLSIEERNALVEQYLWCIDSAMRQNTSLVQATHLDWDDVYQSPAACLIRAVELYRPSEKGRGNLKGYTFLTGGYT